ncbi:hypothetical protein CEXT_199921 [Caerostris extrusa]|uniref:Uncharacterized protein n=1 Tax=Caerostris extrusa TaxID=172846 RepID=A0AAV4P8Y3_CAEEX|nr:hypothetical protein CEXT_199921 [Caerostris extrusa]
MATPTSTAQCTGNGGDYEVLLKNPSDNLSKFHAIYGLTTLPYHIPNDDIPDTFELTEFKPTCLQIHKIKNSGNRRLKLKNRNWIFRLCDI